MTTTMQKSAQPTTAVVRSARVEKLGELDAFFESRKNDLAKALGTMLSPERVLRMWMTMLARPPARTGSASLWECTKVSLFDSLMGCAQLGLEPDPTMAIAYFVPFRNSKAGTIECKLMVGYRGLMQIAERDGDVMFYPPKTIYSKDEWLPPAETPDNPAPTVLHRPYQGEDRDVPIAYLSHAVRQFCGHLMHTYWSMTTTQINKVRARSKAANDGPWVTDYEAMAWKTVIRGHTKFVKQTALMSQAIRHDEDFIDVDALPSRPEQRVALTERLKPIVEPQQLPDDAAADGPVSDGEMVETA